MSWSAAASIASSIGGYSGVVWTLPHRPGDIRLPWIRLLPRITTSTKHIRRTVEHQSRPSRPREIQRIQIPISPPGQRTTKNNPNPRQRRETSWHPSVIRTWRAGDEHIPDRNLRIYPRTTDIWRNNIDNRTASRGQRHGLVPRCGSSGQNIRKI